MQNVKMETISVLPDSCRYKLNVCMNGKVWVDGEFCTLTYSHFMANEKVENIFDFVHNDFHNVDGTGKLRKGHSKC